MRLYEASHSMMNDIFNLSRLIASKRVIGGIQDLQKGINIKNSANLLTLGMKAS